MEVKRWHFWIPPMERNFKLTSGRIYMKNLLKMLLNISYWNCVYVHTCGCTASWSPEQQTGAVQGTSLSESKATMAVHPLTNSLHKFWFAAYHRNPCTKVNISNANRLFHSGAWVQIRSLYLSNTPNTDERQKSRSETRLFPIAEKPSVIRAPCTSLWISWNGPRPLPPQRTSHSRFNFPSIHPQSHPF